MSVFFIALLTFLRLSVSEAAYETCDADIIEHYDKMDLISVPEASERYVYVTLDGTPVAKKDSLTVVAKYADKKLRSYFDGKNDDGVSVNRTTPIFIAIWEGSPSTGKYRLPSDLENVPHAEGPYYTTRYHMDMQYFVRQTNTESLSAVKDLAEKMREEIKALGDYPDSSEFLYLHFGFPNGGIDRENEIWIWKVNSNKVYPTA